MGEAHYERYSELTPREREVLQLLGRGLTNREIGERLGIGFETAKWHVSGILSKLGVDSREQAVIAWQRQSSVTRRLARQVRKPR